MLRGLILLTVVGGLVLFVSPFVISSLYVDQRGVEMMGRVISKREDVTVHYSAWRRTSEVTIRYDTPDLPGVSFFEVRMDPEHYDAFHIGERVKLHYLRRRDIPNLPGANLLWQMHALSVVRLADQRAFSGLERLFTRKMIVIGAAFAALAMLLLTWRLARLPRFGWAVGVCIVVVVPALFLYDFPRPTPRPAVEIRHGEGRVKSVERIDRLLEGDRTRGMLASEPIDVVGIDFVPEGRTEPVLAVDLIDARSAPILRESSPVAIEYEAATPRTAYLRSATRGFLPRNLAGIAGDGGLYLAVLIGGLMIAHLLGRAWTRLLARH
jgi:hypothetical protein